MSRLMIPAWFQEIETAITLRAGNNMYNKTQCDTFVLSEIFGPQYFVADVYS